MSSVIFFSIKKIFPYPLFTVKPCIITPMRMSEFIVKQNLEISKKCMYYMNVCCKLWNYYCLCWFDVRGFRELP